MMAGLPPLIAAELYHTRIVKLLKNVFVIS